MNNWTNIYGPAMAPRNYDGVAAIIVCALFFGFLMFQFVIPLIKAKYVRYMNTKYPNRK